MHERVRIGLARSYQITSIFRRFTVLDNVALAVQARSGSSFRFWRPRVAERALFDEARASLDARRARRPRGRRSPATLAHGEQRQLEVGLALATRRAAAAARRADGGHGAGGIGSAWSR